MSCLKTKKCWAVAMIENRWLEKMYAPTSNYVKRKSENLNSKNFLKIFLSSLLVSSQIFDPLERIKDITRHRDSLDKFIE
mgnify:CR=1 FL=1